MSAGLDHLVLSLAAEPGDARLAEAIERHGVTAAAAACRGRAVAGLRVPPTWVARVAEQDPETMLASAQARGLRWRWPGHAEWPAMLGDLGGTLAETGLGPPVGLWVRGHGHLETLVDRAVAVVGARECTTYGAEVATELGADLADRGWTVVSGAAFGIDASAHRGALAMARPTLAVLAGGVDVEYPRAHTALLGHIAESGVVVSEQPPGAAPQAHRFLARNRLIAALSAGTVVVEAARRSGSLNTLRWADRLGRTSMAVPGPVVSQMSAGTHQAVRDGQAVLVTGVDDVERELGLVGWAVEGDRPA